MMKRLLPLAAALLLGACTAIPVKTLYKLATTDLMTVDPTVLRAAVRMPEWLAPRPDGVKLELGMKRAGEAPVSEKIVLEAIPVALEGKALATEGKPGFDLYAYRIQPQDIPRLQHFRDTFKAKQAEGGAKVEGSLNVGVDACRKTALPDGDIPVTTYLKLEAGADYLPLLVDYDLSKPIAGQDVTALLPPCNGG